MEDADDTKYGDGMDIDDQGTDGYEVVDAPCSEDEVDLNEPSSTTSTVYSSNILLEPLPNAPDGHCLFRALAQMLEKYAGPCRPYLDARLSLLGVQSITVYALRAMVFGLFLEPHAWCDEVLEQWVALASVEVGDDEAAVHLRHYPHVASIANKPRAEWSPSDRAAVVMRAMQADVWGDEMCIAVLSTLLNVRVIVRTPADFTPPWYEYVLQPAVTCILELVHEHYQLCVGTLPPDPTIMYAFSETDLPPIARLANNPRRHDPSGLPSDLAQHYIMAARPFVVAVTAAPKPHTPTPAPSQ